LDQCEADVATNRERYRVRAEVLVKGLAEAGWTVSMPKASMFVWAPLPPSHRAMSAVAFASALLAEARVAIAPGVGFGPGGEGYVRFSLVESEERTAQACAAIKGFLAKPQG
jgi:alanine-synthesizing transaminase